MEKVMDAWDNVLLNPSPSDKHYRPKPMRLCMSCGARLSRYNSGKLCWPCVDSGRSTSAETIRIPYHRGVR